MIKLEKNFHPMCLSPSEAKRLTDEYKKSGKNVWNFEALKSALLETSYGKCAYCECDLLKESNYMEVEHFRDKDRNEDDVVAWLNLLPSCKKCNSSKGTHDVCSEPIVNPYELDPRDHFQFRLYRLYAKTHIGQTSLGVLDLNNQMRAVRVRFEIGEALHDALQSANDTLDSYKVKFATRTKNRLIAQLEGILNECQPNSQYAATAATVLHSDKTYSSLVGEMKNLGLWPSELQALHDRSQPIALDTL